MVKIIFSDIDGTLINDALKVMPRTRKPFVMLLIQVFYLFQFRRVCQRRLSQF